MQVSDLSSFSVIRRSGDVVQFQPYKIRDAIAAAFLKDANGQARRAGATLSQSESAIVEQLTEQVVEAVTGRKAGGGAIHIEAIQDQVELALMRAGQHEVARDYVLYRHHRADQRQAGAGAAAPAVKSVRDGQQQRAFSKAALARLVVEVCSCTEAVADMIAAQAWRDMYNDMPVAEMQRALLLAARAFIERDPAFDEAAARIFLSAIRTEVSGSRIAPEAVQQHYVAGFAQYVRTGVEQHGRLDPRLLQFDLSRLAGALRAERDQQFRYLGLQTLFDRYFLRSEDGHCLEMPQWFFMRVAMGLALNEVDKERHAIEFYDVLSRFDYLCSTPTLFNSGTRVPQLSSCYLTTVADDLDGIFSAIHENAMLQKYAGGLGNDWTRVRALGSYIKGTNGKSQGTIPFLKVVNDTAVAVNQGGKRKGAVCAYLETWHLDIEEFLELRKNVGDDRRRTHDMNTAHWIPDLFMLRVLEGGEWTLFSPNEVPELHELCGMAFERAYTRYEEMARAGQLKQVKTVKAADLWRKMIAMLFETGHPWITFKDACNLRSPQQHCGVVHSSNLCTEITLNTSDEETAVCNLGSVNLVNHLRDGELDVEKLASTVRVAMRMLDNVIEVNYYAVEKARLSNLRHRPVGLGIMGFQDCLHLLRTPYNSAQAGEFAARSMELVSYFAYAASCALSRQRGPYSSFTGSTWEQGLMPQDTLAALVKQRDWSMDVSVEPQCDWDGLRRDIRLYGMRNSNCVAVAPTATIANIVGVSASIEPDYQQLYVKSNLSGEFTVVNRYLVEDLKRAGIWDELMVADIKFHDGSVQAIERVPHEIKRQYVTAFEIDPAWLVKAAAARQVWIDQAQSLNIYYAGSSGKELSQLYVLAWQLGLKTTYYLRTRAATSPEKSTGSGGELNAVNVSKAQPAAACSLDGECEACQ
jgi:ribonucleoside-diphosphate reductase alpha chain